MAGLPWTSLVQAWADGPTRHDAGKVRISASSRTHVHVAVHTGLRRPSEPSGTAAPGNRTRQPPVTARGSTVTRMRVVFPSSMGSQFAVGRGGDRDVQVEPSQDVRA